MLRPNIFDKRENDDAPVATSSPAIATVCFAVRVKNLAQLLEILIVKIILVS